MNVIFIRTPRYIWPFNSETSAFWQPLAFMSLAGQIARDLPQCRVTIIDCPAAKTGWKSLMSILYDNWPDVICIGEEMVSSHEALKLASMVKTAHPETIVIAGGVYFANAREKALASETIDYIVHGEGEITLSHLLRSILDHTDAEQVRGISYRRDDRIITTAPRPLIDNLDHLPMPAWSKVPMQSYGRGSRNHPGLVSIEHSRGCVDSCDFCILWKHMGKTDDDKTVRPCYRSKSPERCLEEVTRLNRDYDRQTFGWVDPTFNADPNWTDRFCDLLLKQNLKIRQTAWVRADCIVRDEQLGILEKAVKSGLCQVMIGVERLDESDLKTLGKKSNGADVTAQAFEILRTKYPSVFTIGSVIFGTWDESRKSLDALAKYRYKTAMDYCFFIPLTPNPGTRVYEQAITRGTIEVADPRAYNFHTPVMRTRNFSARQLETLYFRLLFRIRLDRIANYIRRLFSVSDKRRKRVFLSLFKYGTQITMRYVLSRLRRPFSNKPTVYSRKPAWYDS